MSGPGLFFGTGPDKAAGGGGQYGHLPDFSGQVFINAAAQVFGGEVSWRRGDEGKNEPDEKG